MADRKLKHTGTAFLFAAAVAASVPAFSGADRLTALAASPVTEYDEETRALFEDNVLEYWEIPGLIENYNPEFKNDLEQFYNNPDGSTGLSKTQLLDLAKELRAEADSLSKDAEESKDEISKESYKEYQDNIRALRLYAKQLEEASEGKTASGLAAVWDLRQMRDTQTKEARALMRRYQSELSQNEIQKKNLEISELACQSAKNQRGWATTAEDVLAAEEALNAARADAAAAESVLRKTKQELCIMLGWSYDADPEIRAVPEADQSVIATLHPEADSQMAFNNNYTLRTKQRTPSTSSEFGGKNNKDRKMKEWEDTVRFEMGQLYKNVLQKQTALEAARTAYEAAALDKRGADTSYQIEMMSRQEHMKAEVTFLTAKAEEENANMELLAAIEDYEWAVKGLLEIE